MDMAERIIYQRYCGWSFAAGKCWVVKPDQETFTASSRTTICSQPIPKSPTVEAQADPQYLTDAAIDSDVDCDVEDGYGTEDHIPEALWMGLCSG
jgi:hypothetical protein